MMERQTAQSPDGVPVYGKDETFDVEVGMAVTGPEGQPIGTVAEVAGFGATHVLETAHPETGASVTQAGSGTGYVKVDGVLGTNGQGMTVPFHGIEKVTAEQGLVLNGTVISELHAQTDRIRTAAVEVQPVLRTGWHRWLPGRRA